MTLCGYHHRLVHEGGYGLRRTDDGLFVFTRPNGRRIEENGANSFRGNLPPPVPSTYRGFEDSLRDYLRKHEPGLRITAETSRCHWHGESMDHSQAVEAMQFLEQKAPACLPLPDTEPPPCQYQTRPSFRRRADRRATMLRTLPIR